MEILDELPGEIRSTVSSSGRTAHGQTPHRDMTGLMALGDQKLDLDERADVHGRCDQLEGVELIDPLEVLAVARWRNRPDQELVRYLGIRHQRFTTTN